VSYQHQDTFHFNTTCPRVKVIALIILTLETTHFQSIESIFLGGHLWLMPIIPATQEAQIRRITV
jgi:hypothetical protein